MAHISVLLKETIQGLEIESGDVVVDMTLGNGGHSKEILSSNKNITLIGIDADADAVNEASKNLEQFEAKKILEISYFDKVKTILENHHITKINKALFDLGLRSDQLDSSNRGFSFNDVGPLQMTFTKNPTEETVTAYDVVNDWEEENLADVIYGFGEETFSRRIARAIVEARNEKPIETAKELSEIITNSVPFWYRHKRTHPATKTFQAIRMAVNSELTRIENAIRDVYEMLDQNGRIAVITFHSLEDRLVKRLFNELVEKNSAQLLKKKPIIPSNTEIKENPRSRSAKLRILIKP